MLTCQSAVLSAHLLLFPISIFLFLNLLFYSVPFYSIFIEALSPLSQGFHSQLNFLLYFTSLLLLPALYEFEFEQGLRAGTQVLIKFIPV